jgi:hypothetical protein
VAVIAAALFLSPVAAAWFAGWLHDRPYRRLARDIDRAKGIAQARNAARGRA